MAPASLSHGAVDHAEGEEGREVVTGLEAEREAFGRPVAETHHGQSQTQVGGSTVP